MPQAMRVKREARVSPGCRADLAPQALWGHQDSQASPDLGGHRVSGKYDVKRK